MYIAISPTTTPGRSVRKRILVPWCHGLDAQPARFQHEHVVGLFVLTDQDGPLGELPALEVRPQAGRHAGEPIARPVHDDGGSADSALEQTLLAPLQAAVQVRLEPDDPPDSTTPPCPVASAPDRTRP